jgi:hypothetical protein
MKEQLESVVLQMYRAGVRCSEAVREFQRAFILTRYSRIKEVISARLPRNSAYTGIPYAVRSETWRLTSALHEQWGGVDQRDQRFQCRPCGVRPLSCSSTAATRTGVLFCPASAHHRRERALPPHLIRSMIRPYHSMPLQSAGTAISAMANPTYSNVLGSSGLAGKPSVTPL